jgi:hypothetical protein
MLRERMKIETFSYRSDTNYALHFDTIVGRVLTPRTTVAFERMDGVIKARISRLNLHEVQRKISATLAIRTMRRAA